MEKVALKVKPRLVTGKGPNRRLRASGQIPAVIYGAGAQPEKVTLDAHELQLLLQKYGASAMFTLTRDDGNSGEEVNAVIREIQRDPVTRRILHVDLYHVRMDVEAEFEVPVHAVGNAIGVREGGILETLRHTVEVRCLPGLLPKAIEADISGLRINHSFHASDLKLPEGVKLVTDPEEVLFNILPPKDYVEPTPTAEGEEIAQPEVISKKKEAEPEEENE
ncbi:MAG: 50S ribosomal protein L25 [Candidatus Sumerlaea chitinivorans]|nr:50S ribosomal protein L25 [Candidatus Sumerlaea chitinivorans]